MMPRDIHRLTNLWEVADYMTAVIIVLGHDIK